MRSIYVSAEVDLSDVLYDTTTDELLEELKRRGAADPELELVPLLKKAGVPHHLVQPIEDWLAQPVANASLLDRWKAWCNGQPPNGTA